MIGRPDAELVEEEIAKRRIEILSGVHEHVLAQAIELFNDAAQANDLRARAQNRHDFHASMSSS